MKEAGTATGRTMRFRDGRLLGYAEYGDPAGMPLLYFRGHPDSRLEAGLLDQEAGGRVCDSSG